MADTSKIGAFKLQSVAGLVSFSYFDFVQLAPADEQDVLEARERTGGIVSSHELAGIALDAGAEARLRNGQALEISGLALGAPEFPRR